MSKHYDAWSQALNAAAVIARREALFNRFIYETAVFVQLLHDDLVSRLPAQSVYYGDEPCDCAMCRPVGGRVQHYDC